MPMKFPAIGGGSDFKRAPAGSHIAVCNLVVDVGLQPGSQQYPSPKHKIYVRFEIPAERIEYEKDGERMEGPITIGSFYTASMNEKATLRKHLEGWRGRAFTDEQAADFDVSAILGKACMLSVIEDVYNGKVYANIASISGLPKGVPAPTPENPILYYAPDEPNGYDDLPQWLREKISAQLLQPAQPSASEASADPNDDIPF